MKYILRTDHESDRCRVSVLRLQKATAPWWWFLSASPPPSSWRPPLTAETCTGRSPSLLHVIWIKYNKYKDCKGCQWSIWAQLEGTLSWILAVMTTIKILSISYYYKYLTIGMSGWLNYEKINTPLIHDGAIEQTNTHSSRAKPEVCHNYCFHVLYFSFSWKDWEFCWWNWVGEGGGNIVPFYKVLLLCLISFMILLIIFEKSVRYRVIAT